MTTLRRHQRPTLTLTERPAATQRGTNKLDMSARKLRVLVAGEFSAGKTRLINGLLGERVLPSNVVATALPPVWLVGGAERVLRRVDHDGEVHPLEALEAVDVETTRYCVLSHPASILDTIEIIDTPGSSDPNMPAETWRQMIDYADLIIWCTNATQAWRQSEKSIWDEMPEELRAHALLVITHGDRLTDERSAQRVLRRVEREAGSYFAAIMLASLVKPADITQVMNRIAQILPEITEPPGAPNPIIENFLRERSVIAFPKPRPEIRPRRVLHAQLIKRGGTTEAPGHEPEPMPEPAATHVR
jgi:predicted GTPase